MKPESIKAKAARKARPSQSPIPQAMLDYLLGKYTVGDEFIAMDLYHVAEKYTHAMKSCTSNQLRVLVACGCVTRTLKRIKNDHGGSGLIVYMLTGKTTVEVVWKERRLKPKAKKPIKPVEISLKLSRDFVTDETFFGLERRMLEYCKQNSGKSFSNSGCVKVNTGYTPRKSS
jgi:hypothetical protein